jgi:hypothetical protein
MDQTEARAFAEQWVRDWNAHDVDALLAHFTDDVVFTSPVAVRVLGGDGVVRGKEALRRYWSEGIRLIPDLHLEVLALYVGISTLVINYRNQAGGVVSEVLTFDGALVCEGHGTYLTQVLRGRRLGASSSPTRIRQAPDRTPSKMMVAARAAVNPWARNSSLIRGIARRRSSAVKSSASSPIPTSIARATSGTCPISSASLSCSRSGRPRARREFAAMSAFT